MSASAANKRDGSRSQLQRRTHTRTALLDAAVSCLVNDGFARTTTLEVQKRAQLSRGALLHHFPTKAELMTATIVHLGEMRGRELRQNADQLPNGRGRMNAVLDLLWQSFTGPLFYVTMELRTAARTDSDLRVALAATERHLHERIVVEYSGLFGADIAGRPGFGRALDLTLQMMIGAAMSLLTHGAQSVRIEKLIAHWKTMFPELLGLAKTSTASRPQPRMDKSR
jgi:AcrR family transcriptional regulator